MLHLDAVHQLTLDRGRQLRHEAEVGRLAVQARRRRQQRRRRVLDAMFGLLLRGRHHQRYQGTHA